MDKAYLTELLLKHKAGTLTQAERLELDKWYLAEARAGEPLTDPAVFDARLLQMDAAFPFQQAKETRKAKLWPRIAAAASIVLVAGAGLFFIAKQNDKVTLEREALAQIRPGSNKAFLVLSDGKRISLTDAANGRIAKETGVEVSKSADGQLVYTVSSAKQTDTPSYNTIETPKGGTYQVRLPDGSNVWLNADSKIRFLSSLTAGLRRRIELSGEAYFEVAKDAKRPFIVSSAGQEIQVLGTHFNVNSYSNEPSVKTTLLEGSVRVSSNGVSQLLVPGEQSAFAAGRFSVSPADVEDAVAWKNGKFVFEDEDVKSVMRKLARWYDIEVEYETGAGDKLVTAQISRFDNISKILEKIRYTKAANFKVAGRRITVMP